MKDLVSRLVQEYAVKGFVALLMAIGGYASTQLSKVADSIQELNKNMAVVVQAVGTHENRINKIEAKVFK